MASKIIRDKRLKGIPWSQDSPFAKSRVGSMANSILQKIHYVTVGYHQGYSKMEVYADLMTKAI